MNLQWHTPDNTKANVRTVVSTVYIHKSGRIRFNPAAIDLLKLKHLDRVLFANDEENPADWFIKKDVNGFTVAVRNDRTTLSAYISSKKLSYEILKSLNRLQLEYVTFKISDIPSDNIYPVITSRAIKEK